MSDEQVSELRYIEELEAKLDMAELWRAKEIERAEKAEAEVEKLRANVDWFRATRTVVDNKLKEAEAKLAEVEKERDRLAKAIVETVIPLEVIAGADRMQPYAELSDDLMVQVHRSIEAARAALASLEADQSKETV